MTQEPKKMDRRKFIYAGLGAAAVVIVGGGAVYFATRPSGVTTTTSTAGTTLSTETHSFGPQKLTLLEGTSPSSLVRIDEATKWAQKNSVTLEIVKAGGMDRFQKLAIATQAGEAPYDVVALWGSQVLSAAGSKLIMPLDDYISSSYWDAFFPLSESLYNGQHYGVPYLNETQVLFYRVDLFQNAGFELPITASKLLESGKDLMKTTNGATEVYAWCNYFGDPEETMCQFATGLFANGGTWVTKDGTPAFNGPEGVDVLQWWISLLDAGMEPAPIELMQADAATLFAKGKIACSTIWMGQRQYVDDTSLSVLKPEQWGFSSVPEFKSSTSLTGSDFYGVARLSKNPQLAVQLAQYLISESVQKRQFLEAKITPSIRSLYDDPDLQNAYGAQKLKAALEQTNQAGFKPLYWWANDFYPILQKEIQNAVTKAKTPKQALDDAAAQLEQVIAKGPA